LDGTIHFWTPCQELVLLYDMIEWLNILHSMPGVSQHCTPCQEFIWTNFALHARSFVNLALHARSLFERTLHSMPGVYLNFALHVRKFSRLCTPCQEFTFYEHFLFHAGSFNDFTKYSKFYGRDQAFANL
jgi:hypothetical protein